MELSKKVEKLEIDMFEVLTKAHQAIQSRDRESAKYFIASIEVMNDEYYDITEVEFIKESVVLDLYERLWRTSNES